MDQFRERKRAEAHVSPALGSPVAAGQVNAHARATAAVVAATVAATAQVKVHWRKRGLTETRAQSSQVGNHCSISLKSLSRVYIEISAKGQRSKRSPLTQNAKWSMARIEMIRKRSMAKTQTRYDVNASIARLHK